MTIQEIQDYNDKYEKLYVAGLGWIDIEKTKPIEKKLPVDFRTASQNPTPEQKKMNNGMTLRKMRILTRRADKNISDAKRGKISWATVIVRNTPIYRDIRILSGDEIAYLQG